MDLEEIRAWATFLFSVIILPLFYFLTQARARLEEKIDSAVDHIANNGDKIDTLDERVREANGRLGSLETWSKFHQQQDVAWHEETKDLEKEIRDQLKERGA